MVFVRRLLRTEFLLGLANLKFKRKHLSQGYSFGSSNTIDAIFARKKWDSAVSLQNKVQFKSNLLYVSLSDLYAIYYMYNLQNYVNP